MAAEQTELFSDVSRRINSLKDVLMACCVKDEKNQYADTVVSISVGTSDDYSLDSEVVTRFMKANLGFMMTNGLLEANFQFRSKSDPNLIRMFRLLDSYWEKEDSESKINIIEIALLPASAKGKYQVSFINPYFFVLCADAPGEDARTIKLFVDSGDILISELKNFDYGKVAADVQREMDMEAFYEKEEEKRKREAYESERLWGVLHE